MARSLPVGTVTAADEWYHHICRLIYDRVKSVQSGAELGESHFLTRLTSSLEMNLKPFSQQDGRRNAVRQMKRSSQVVRHQSARAARSSTGTPRGWNKLRRLSSETLWPHEILLNRGRHLEPESLHLTVKKKWNVCFVTNRKLPAGGCLLQKGQITPSSCHFYLLLNWNRPGWCCRNWNRCCLMFSAHKLLFIRNN